MDGREGVGTTIGGRDIDGNAGKSGSGSEIVSDSVGIVGIAGIGIAIGGIDRLGSGGRSASGSAIESESVGRDGSDGIGIVIGGIEKLGNEQALKSLPSPKYLQRQLAPQLPTEQAETR